MTVLQIWFHIKNDNLKDNNQMKVTDEQIQAKLNYLLKNQCVHFMRQLF